MMNKVAEREGDHGLVSASLGTDNAGSGLAEDVLCGPASSWCTFTSAVGANHGFWPEV